MRDLQGALRKAQGQVQGAFASALIDLQSALHIAMNYPDNYPQHLKDTLVAAVHDRLRGPAVTTIEDEFRKGANYTGHYIKMDIFLTESPKGGIWHVIWTLPRPHEDIAVIYVVPMTTPIGIVYKSKDTLPGLVAALSAP